MAGPLDIYNFVQGQGEIGRQRGQRNRLAELAGQAYNAPQSQQRGLVAQAIQNDPQSGLALGQSLDSDRTSRMTGLSQRARMLVGYAKAGNAQGVNSIYPQLAQEAESLGLGQGIPQQWDDSFLPGMEQLANLGIGNSAGMQEFSALTSGLSAEDAQRARRIKLGLDPRAVTGSRKTGTIKGADGHERPYVYDPSSNTYQVFDRTRGWRDMSPGEAQQAEAAPQAQSAPPQPGLYNTPNGQARIETELSPQQWQAVQQDMANGGQADQYQLPQRDVSPAQFYGGQRQPTPQAPQAPQGGALPPRYDYQDGGLLVGQSAAEQAGASEAAKIAAQLQYAPQVAQAEAHAAQLKAEAESAGKPTKAQEAVDSQYGKEYVEFLQGGAADANKALTELSDALQQLQTRTDLTGPWLSTVPMAVRVRTNPESVALQETVESTVQRSLRVILGAQFTEKEGERLIARAFNPALSERENATRVERLLTQLQQGFSNKEAMARFYEQNGTLRGFTGRIPSWSDFDGGAGTASPQQGRTGGSPQRRKYNPATGRLE